MTDWLIHGKLPKGLALADECELRDPAEAGAVVRCRRQDLESDEVREHLKSGKQVFQLGLVFDGRVGFVLGEDLVVRKLRFLDQVLDSLLSGKGAPPPELAAFLMPAAHNSHRDFGAAERCLIGAPSAPLVPDLDLNYIQILQSKTQVAFLGDTDRRIAALDGRPPLSPRLGTWSGISRARWEGDTLVVETRNFNNRTRSFSGAGSSTEKVVTERFTRRSAKRLDYEATIVDPKAFTDKVVIAFPMALVDGRVYENACHEHNYSLANALSAARKAERDAAAKP
jgi:hypothetical protein